LVEPLGQKIQLGEARFDLLPPVFQIVGRVSRRSLTGNKKITFGVSNFIPPS